MSTGVQFDRGSAERIARATVAVEQGLGIPTKRRRRPIARGLAGELVLVRLLEDIPAATLFVPDLPDLFYGQLREALGTNLGEVAIEDIQRYLDGKSEDKSIGSGLAVLCELNEAGGDLLGTEGDERQFTLSYVEVVTVYNMHARDFNTIDSGGIFGNEAGSLGAGFCNATTGTDGRLWLVSPDRQAIVRALDGIDEIRPQLTATVALLQDVIERLGEAGVEGF